jgi:hypothetical protein
VLFIAIKIQIFLERGGLCTRIGAFLNNTQEFLLDVNN